jgi:hypothetical protein
MKSLFIACAFLALVTSLSAQTNAAPAATPVKAPDAATPDAKPGASKSDSTNEAAIATKPYPVTAIVVSNTITFPILLSKKSETLMTNAVYKRTYGRKVLFTSDITLKSFDIDQLHPSVIAQLDLDPSKAKADQEALEKQKQEWAAQNQQQNQQLLAAEAAALSKNQAAQTAAATNSDPNAGAPPGAAKTHHHKTAPPAPPAAN